MHANWKETTVEIRGPLQALRIRLHSNIMRRPIARKEKHDWVMKARKLLSPEDPTKRSQRELAKALGISRGWVEKYDTLLRRVHGDPEWKDRFWGYNVWGFKDDSWRRLIVKGDPNQPDKDAYHGATPSFVVHQLIKMFQPKTVLDSMAGVGTTGYVCGQYENIECDQFDIYPYPKYDVVEGDAEHIAPACMHARRYGSVYSYGFKRIL